MVKTLLERLCQRPSTMPRPFPGEYPTRVLIKANGGRVPFVYAGKLSPHLLTELRRNYFVKGGEYDRLTYHECDQNGTIFRIEKGYRDLRINFAELYFPMYRPMIDLFWNGTILFYALSRVPALVEKRYTTKVELLKGTEWEETEQLMVSDCARGRVPRDWFSRDALMGATLRINELATKWLVAAPKPKKKLKLALPPTAPAMPQKLVYRKVDMRKQEQRTLAAMKWERAQMPAEQLVRGEAPRAGETHDEYVRRKRLELEAQRQAHFDAQITANTLRDVEAQLRQAQQTVVETANVNKLNFFQYNTLNVAPEPLPQNLTWTTAGANPFLDDNEIN